MKCILEIQLAPQHFLLLVRNKLWLSTTTFCHQPTQSGNQPTISIVKPRSTPKHSPGKWVFSQAFPIETAGPIDWASRSSWLQLASDYKGTWIAMERSEAVVLSFFHTYLPRTLPASADDTTMVATRAAARIFLTELMVCLEL